MTTCLFRKKNTSTVLIVYNRYKMLDITDECPETIDTGIKKKDIYTGVCERAGNFTSVHK